MKRAACLAFFVLIAGAIPATLAQLAPKYPERPVRIVVGYSPGTTSDQAAKLL